MDHLTLPIDALREDAAFFLRTKGLRFLHVAVDEPLRDNALKTLAAMEWAPDNVASAVITLAHETHGKGGAGWTHAMAGLRTGYERARGGLAEAGVKIPELPAVPEREEPLTVFAMQLHSALAALTSPPAPAQDLLLIFAPGDVERDKDLARELGQLLRVGQLAKVRWIWVETGKGKAGAALCKELGDDVGAHHACHIDPERQRRDLDELLDAMADAPEDAVGLARAGAAWARRRPPAHPDDPPVTAPEADAAPVAPGPDPVKPFLKALRALRKGDAAGAVALQREARDAAMAGGVTPLAVDMDVLLATFLAQALATESLKLTPAIELLQKAAARAEGAGLHLPAAKVCLVLAGYARVAKNHELLGLSLRRAANHARDAGVPALQIEALRQAAEGLIEGRHDEAAAKLLHEAIDAAEKLKAAEVRATGAGACARMLAGIFRRKGQEARAQEIERRFGATEPETAESGVDPTGTEGD